MSDKVVDIVDQNAWKLTPDWPSRFIQLANIPVPFHQDRRDEIVSRDKRLDFNFSVSTVSESICEFADQVNWYKLVWYTHAIRRNSFFVWLIMGNTLKTQDKLKQWDLNDS